MFSMVCILQLLPWTIRCAALKRSKACANQYFVIHAIKKHIIEVQNWSSAHFLELEYLKKNGVLVLHGWMHVNASWFFIAWDQIFLCPPCCLHTRWAEPVAHVPCILSSDGSCARECVLELKVMKVCFRWFSGFQLGDFQLQYVARWWFQSFRFSPWSLGKWSNLTSLHWKLTAKARENGSWECNRFLWPIFRGELLVSGRVICLNWVGLTTRKKKVVFARRLRPQWNSGWVCRTMHLKIPPVKMCLYSELILAKL